MKERTLKLLRKCKAMDYYRTWKLKWIYESELTIDSTCRSEWVYFNWAGMAIHYNTFKDKITVYCDQKVWTE